MIERTQELISPYVEKDPTKFCTYEEFEAGIETLKAFCLLRAESISGQLEGTIASTSDGQLQSSDTLIDASGINISDMGSMNNSMGGGMNMQNRMGGFDPANESQTTGQTQESNAQSQTENPPSTSANETQNDTGARQNSNASDRKTGQPVIPSRRICRTTRGSREIGCKTGTQPAAPLKTCPVETAQKIPRPLTKVQTPGFCSAQAR